MKNKRIVLPSAPILIVDIEGNGHSPPDLVEISIQRFEQNFNQEYKNKTWLIKPKNKISKIVTKIHGIKNSDVESLPMWDDIKEEVFLMLDKSWFVAHNAKIDYNVIKRHLPKWKPLGIIDTLKLAKNILPNAPSYSLEKLMHYTGLLSGNSISFHRASCDVEATSQLLKFLIAKSGFDHWNQICQVSQISISSNKEDNLPTQGELW